VTRMMNTASTMLKRYSLQDVDIQCGPRKCKGADEWERSRRCGVRQERLHACPLRARHSMLNVQGGSRCTCIATNVWACNGGDAKNSPSHGRCGSRQPVRRVLLGSAAAAGRSMGSGRRSLCVCSSHQLSKQASAHTLCWPVCWPMPMRHGPAGKQASTGRRVRRAARQRERSLGQVDAVAETVRWWGRSGGTVGGCAARCTEVRAVPPASPAGAKKKKETEGSGPLSCRARRYASVL
jgi:hypothetical protein